MDTSTDPPDIRLEDLEDRFRELIAAGIQEVEDRLGLAEHADADRELAAEVSASLANDGDTFYLTPAHRFANARNRNREALAAARRDLAETARRRALVFAQLLALLDPRPRLRRLVGEGNPTLAAFYLANDETDGPFGELLTAVRSNQLVAVEAGRLARFLEERNAETIARAVKKAKAIKTSQGRPEKNAPRLVPSQYPVRITPRGPAAPIGALEAIRQVIAFLEPFVDAATTPLDLYPIATGGAVARTVVGIASPAAAFNRAKAVESKAKTKTISTDPSKAAAILTEGGEVEALRIVWPGGGGRREPVQLALPFVGEVGEVGALIHELQGQANGPLLVRVLEAIRTIASLQRTPAGTAFWLYEDELLELLFGDPDNGRKNRDRVRNAIGFLHRAQLQASLHRKSGDRVEYVASVVQLGAVEIHHKAGADLEPLESEPDFHADPATGGFRQEVKVHPVLLAGLTEEDGSRGSRFAPARLIALRSEGKKSTAKELVPAFDCLNHYRFWSTLHNGKKKPHPREVEVTISLASLAADLNLESRRKRVDRRGSLLRDLLELTRELGIVGGYDDARADFRRLEGTLTLRPPSSWVAAHLGDADWLSINRELPTTGSDVAELVESAQAAGGFKTRSEAVEALAGFYRVGGSTLWAAMKDGPGAISPHLRAAFRARLWMGR